jgi:hypothetical protein
MVQEAIHSSRCRKEKRMVIEMDMASAFDQVQLSFLFAIKKREDFLRALFSR